MIDNDTVHGRIAGRQNLVFVRLRRHVFKLKVSLIIFQVLQRYNHVKGKVNSAINSGLLPARSRFPWENAVYPIELSQAANFSVTVLLTRSW